MDSQENKLSNFKKDLGEVIKEVHVKTKIDIKNEEIEALDMIPEDEVEKVNILVQGFIKAGKSSLCNEILRNPNNEESEDDGEEEYCPVEDGEFTPFLWKVCHVGDWSSLLLKNYLPSEVIDPSVRGFYVKEKKGIVNIQDRFEKVNFKGKDNPFDELHEFITSLKLDNCAELDRFLNVYKPIVRVFTRNPFLKKFTIIDSPGKGSYEKYGYDELVMEHAIKSDLMILAFAAGQGNFNAVNVQYLKRLIDACQKTPIPLHERIFFLGNKADKLVPKRRKRNDKRKEYISSKEIGSIQATSKFHELMEEKKGIAFERINQEDLFNGRVKMEQIFFTCCDEDVDIYSFFDDEKRRLHNELVERREYFKNVLPIKYALKSILRKVNKEIKSIVNTKNKLRNQENELHLLTTCLPELNTWMDDIKKRCLEEFLDEMKGYLGVGGVFRKPNLKTTIHCDNIIGTEIKESVYSNRWLRVMKEAAAKNFMLDVIRKEINRHLTDIWNSVNDVYGAKTISASLEFYDQLLIQAGKGNEEKKLFNVVELQIIEKELGRMKENTGLLGQISGLLTTLFGQKKKDEEETEGEAEGDDKGKKSKTKNKFSASKKWKEMVILELLKSMENHKERIINERTNELGVVFDKHRKDFMMILEEHKKDLKKKINEEKESSHATTVLLNNLMKIKVDLLTIKHKYEIGHHRFEIGNIINRGGQGKIYEGKKDGKEIAVKELIFPAELHYLSFLNEVEIMSSKSHPNIVEFISAEYFKDGGTFGKGILYMKKHPCSLRDFILKNDVTLAWIIDVLIQIADCMEFLHMNNLFHRDLKPGNILVGKDKKTVFICDFGFSKSYGSSEFTLVGTPGEVIFDGFGGQDITQCGYMDPVLCFMSKNPYNRNKKKDYDLRVDVYSFGVMMAVLFEKANTPVKVASEEMMDFLKDTMDLQEKMNMVVVRELSHEYKGEPDIRNEYYNVVKKCTRMKIHERPFFKEIKADLNFLKGLLVVESEMFT